MVWRYSMFWVCFEKRRAGASVIFLTYRLIRSNSP